MSNAFFMTIKNEKKQKSGHSTVLPMPASSLSFRVSQTPKKLKREARFERVSNRHKVLEKSKSVHRRDPPPCVPRMDMHRATAQHDEPRRRCGAVGRRPSPGEAVPRARQIFWTPTPRSPQSGRAILACRREGFGARPLAPRTAARSASHTYDAPQFDAWRQRPATTLSSSAAR